jgi:opacity protein-like surface antigen
MQNKILTLIALLGISNTAFAANGFYIGASAGAADFMNKESHSVAPESHQLGSIGAVGGLFGGYDVDLNNWARLGIEGFVEATSLSTSISHAANTYQMNEDYNFGIRLLPEYVFSQATVGHIILGYVNGRFRIQDNGVYGIINTTYHQSGMQTGLGISTALQNNFFIRLDALYDAYASTTNTGTGLTTPTQSYTNRFSQLAGELGILYKFC